MNITLSALLAAIVLLIALSAILATPKVQAKLVGNNPVLIALLPLTAAGIIWATAWIADLMKSKIEESSVPEDVLTVLIQDVQFGFPEIPNSFKTQELSNHEVFQTLAPLRRVQQSVTLTPEQFEQLDSLAKQSAQLDQFDSNKVLGTQEISDLLVIPLYFTHRYSRWSAVTRSWSDFINSQKNDSDKQKVLADLVVKVSDTLSSAGIFQAIVGMASRGMIDLTPADNDCSTVAFPDAKYEIEGDKQYITFYTFQSLIGTTGGRTDHLIQGKKFGHIFEYACLQTFARIALRASETLDSEAKLMTRYVEEWGQILASEEAESISIRVAISNVGRFDSFIRNDAKVVVGPKGAAYKLRFNIKLVHPLLSKKNEEEEEDETVFLQIKSRSTEILNFSAKLPSDIQNKLHGAYSSELTFMRLGILASAGPNEGQVLSQIAPFSTKAHLEFDQKLDDMKIVF